MNRRKLINNIIREYKNKPFVWGKSDCFVFCGLIEKELTGKDPTTLIRRQYRSQQTAAKLMKKNNWDTLADVARSLHKEIPIAFAKAGDWAIVLEDDIQNLGIVVNNYIVVRTKNGLGFMPLTSGTHAFKVLD